MTASRFDSPNAQSDEIRRLRAAVHDRDVLLLRCQQALMSLNQILRAQGVKDPRLDLAELVGRAIEEQVREKGLPEA
jgi:hypothetical protein